MGRRSQRQLDLPGGIGAQAAGDDGAHLVAKPGEAAEVVEHAALAAPEEHVGVGRQLVPVGAQFHLPLRAMVGEVAVDDAVLQHAAERQRKAARRPGELAGDRVVGAEQHRRARAIAAMPRAMPEAEPIRTCHHATAAAASSATTTAKVAL